MSKKKRDYSVVGLTLGVFIMAIGILSFLDPHGVAPGGITGFGVALKSLTGIPIYKTNLIVNIPLFVLTIFILGFAFGWRTFYATIMLSVFLKVLPFTVPCPNIVLGATLGGLFTGAGIGMVLSAGGTTGGTDLVSVLVKHYVPKIKIPNLMMVLDGCIILFSMVVQKDIRIGLFSVLSMICLTRTINFVLESEIFKVFYIKEYS